MCAALLAQPCCQSWAPASAEASRRQPLANALASVGVKTAFKNAIYLPSLLQTCICRLELLTCSAQTGASPLKFVGRFQEVKLWQQCPSPPASLCLASSCLSFSWQWHKDRWLQWLLSYGENWNYRIPQVRCPQ